MRHVTLADLPNYLGVHTGAGRFGLAPNRYRLATFRYRARGAGRVSRRVARRVLERARCPVPAAERLTSERVALDRILLGNQAGLLGNEFARRSGHLRWSSTRVADGPHADLLRRALRDGLDTAVGRDFGETPYGRLVRDCLALEGNFFGVTSLEGGAQHARKYAQSFLSGEWRDDQYAGRSLDRSMVRVRPIEHSDCHQLLDGHHRLARAAVSGEAHVLVSSRGAPTPTALQEYLARMKWLGGSRELYQPLDAPELSTEWTPVRRCRDRLDKVLSFLTYQGVPPSSSYLDVAACYGWFVASMLDAGYEAEGVEVDPMAPELGHAAYGLDQRRIHSEDAVVFLRRATKRRDVVSCFSLLHHFVLGRGSCGAEEFVRLLAGATGRVLFLDTGQGDESWFRDSLAGWTPEFIRVYLREHGGFSEVIDLGPDEDRVVPYHRNYGRHLFACIP